MIKKIKAMLGITELIHEQKKTNQLLESILKECKRNSDLVESDNDARYIKKRHY